jgi:hypothetical protein
MTIGIDSHRPLTTTEKGLLIAGTTLATGPLAVLGGGSRLALFAWKARPFTVPLAFGMTPRLPGGGGPGSGTPTSTDQARAEHYRHIYGGY